MSTELLFPSFLNDNNAKKICQKLLKKAPEERCTGGFNKIKKDRWFRSFDWDKLYNREIKPPYLPDNNNVITENQIQAIAEKKIPIVEELKASRFLFSFCFSKRKNRSTWLKVRSSQKRKIGMLSTEFSKT